MLKERDPDSHLYDAWHAKADAMWSVDPARLDELARQLEECATAADAIGTAWEEHFQRGGI
jgi:hypothetical protein